MPKHRIGREQVFDTLNRRGDSHFISGGPLDFESGVERGNQLRKLRNPSSIELAQSHELSGIGGAFNFGIEDLLHVVNIGLDTLARDLKSQVVEHTEAKGALGDSQRHALVLNAIHD